jgi:hypothetical protein
MYINSTEGPYSLNHILCDYKTYVCNKLSFPGRQAVLVSNECFGTCVCYLGSYQVQSQQRASQPCGARHQDPLLPSQCCMLKLHWRLPAPPSIRVRNSSALKDGLMFYVFFFNVFTICLEIKIYFGLWNIAWFGSSFSEVKGLLKRGERWHGIMAGLLLYSHFQVRKQRLVLICAEGWTQDHGNIGILQSILQALPACLRPPQSQSLGAGTSEVRWPFSLFPPNPVCHTCYGGTVSQQLLDLGNCLPTHRALELQMAVGKGWYQRRRHHPIPGKV